MCIINNVNVTLTSTQTQTTREATVMNNEDCAAVAQNLNIEQLLHKILLFCTSPAVEVTHCTEGDCDVGTFRRRKDVNIHDITPSDSLIECLAEKGIKVFRFDEHYGNVLIEVDECTIYIGQNTVHQIACSSTMKHGIQKYLQTWGEHVPHIISEGIYPQMQELAIPQG